MDDQDPIIVKHWGRSYLLHDLLAFVPSKSLRIVSATQPETPQAIWDEVVLRWPSVASDAAGSCHSV